MIEESPPEVRVRVETKYVDKVDSSQLDKIKSLEQELDDLKKQLDEARASIRELEGVAREHQICKAKGTALDPKQKQEIISFGPEVREKRRQNESRSPSTERHSSDRMTRVETQELLSKIKQLEKDLKEATRQPKHGDGSKQTCAVCATTQRELIKLQREHSGCGKATQLNMSELNALRKQLAKFKAEHSGCGDVMQRLRTLETTYLRLERQHSQCGKASKLDMSDLTDVHKQDEKVQSESSVANDMCSMCR